MRSAVIAVITAATASHCRNAARSGFRLLLSGGAEVTALSPRLRARCQLTARSRSSSRRTPAFLLPLWEKVARTKSVPDEGFLSIDRPEPLTRLEFAALIRATLSHKGRGEESRHS